MTEQAPQEFDKDTMPFVAPCRQLGPFAPFRWIKKGIADFRKAPRLSLTYGVVMAAIMAIVVLLAWIYGSHWFMLAMLGGFVFIAPLSCIGLYAVSAQLERDQAPSMARSLRAAFRRHLGNEMVFALVLLVIFMVWARAAVMLSIFIPTGSSLELGDLITYLGVGTVVGAMFRSGYVFGERILPADDHAPGCRQHHRHRHVDQCGAAQQTGDGRVADPDTARTRDRHADGIHWPGRHFAGHRLRCLAWLPRDHRRVGFPAP